MDQIYSHKQECCGCGACETICPVSAISMKSDDEGFDYSHVDVQKCLHCGLCTKICPLRKDSPKPDTGTLFQQRYFAVQHKDRDIVAHSSSGGMFTALSDCILASGGVVYGAAFDSSFKVCHDRAETKKGRNSFRGSKYIQSCTKSVFRLIQEDLSQGRVVLFTGTPCQTAGVKNYLLQNNHTLDNLLLCDFICHGTASPKVWESYVHYFDGKYKGGLSHYEFRNKKDGWHHSKPLLKTENGDISHKYSEKKSFMRMYRTGYLDRPSCYTCKYADYTRCSDLTIGDFWNIGSVCPEMDDNTGTSQVLINTETGQKWFDLCLDNLKYYECGKADVWQPHLEYPANVNLRKRENFWESYRSLPFEKVLAKYGQGDIMTKCKSFAVPVAKKLGLYVLAGKLYRRIFVKKTH